MSLLTIRRPEQIAGSLSKKQQQLQGVKQKQLGSLLVVRGVISSGDNKGSSSILDDSNKKLVKTNDINGGSAVSSSSSSSSGIDVKAVITIRKKLKEKMSDKIEDQWESFIIGIGQGIFIQLISQHIDPGNSLYI